MLVSLESFGFWWALLILGLLRVNNSSMFVTVLVRRYIYYCLPKSLRFMTSMEQNS